jgi:hypothetical protein
LLVNRPLAALACVAALAAAGTARAQNDSGYIAPEPPRITPPPPDGMKFITAGIVLVGAGTLDLVMSPVCATDFIRRDLHKACLGTTLGVASAALVVGIPLLVIGAGRRHKFLDWHAKHDAAFGISAGKDHGVLAFRASF